jgi:hypothetical protein
MACFDIGSFSRSLIIIRRAFILQHSRLQVSRLAGRVVRKLFTPPNCRKLGLLEMILIEVLQEIIIFGVNIITLSCFQIWVELAF